MVQTSIAEFYHKLTPEEAKEQRNYSSARLAHDLRIKYARQLVLEEQKASQALEKTRANTRARVQAYRNRQAAIQEKSDNPIFKKYKKVSRVHFP